MRAFLSSKRLLFIAAAITACAIPSFSSRASGAPVQVAQSNELQSCEYRLRVYKTALGKEQKLRDNVKAKKIILINIPDLPRGTAGSWEPVSVDELRDVLTISMYTGQANAAQVAELVRKMRAESINNLAVLEEAIDSLGNMIATTAASCASLQITPANPNPPAAPGTTFALDASMTQISNPNAPALKDIDPGAGSAVWDHTGPYGDGGNGGDWNVKYFWRVPRYLTAGRNSSITLGLTVTQVNPVQSIGFAIGALAPDFAQTLQFRYPNKSGDSATYVLPIAADQASSREITITIRFVSAQVVYHYRHL